MKIATSIGFSGLALLLVAASLSAQQQAGPQAEATEYPSVYRVEVVVFLNVDGRSDRIRSAAPLDFTGRLDPLLVARVNETAERQLAGLAEFLPVAALPGETDETTPYLQSEEQILRPIPPAYSALSGFSRPIQRAFDRLIDAPEYDPVTARAWIQLAPRGRPTATVRIHDQDVVDVIRPDEDRSLVPVLDVLPFPQPATTPHPALEVYRLDGTIQLRHRQFLHLDLDLVWQTPALVLADRETPPGGPPPAGGDRDGNLQLHRLQQSRIVRPGRLEYFDSSLFGVLVMIERFRQVVPEIEVPEPQPATADTPASQELVDPVTNSGG